MNTIKIKNSGIYLWIFPNNKKYIGKTNNLVRRYNSYKYKSKDKKNISPIYNALRKYGIENCEFRILELTGDMPNEEILFRESLWIKFYRSLVTENGYNVASYSNDCTGCKRSDKTKEKISQFWKNNLHPNLNRIVSLETKLKQSLSAKNKPESVKKRTSDARRKPVNQLDLAGNFIRRWSSAKEAAITLGNKNRSSDITLICKKRLTKSGYFRYIALGFKWEYSN